MLGFFRKKYSEEELKQFIFLRKNHLFKDLTNEMLLKIIPFLYERRYMKDEVIFFRKDPSQALYIIRSGVASLNLDIGEEFETFMNVSSGEAFGDNCLVGNMRRDYTVVVASEELSLYAIPKPNLVVLFKEDPEIGRRVYAAMAKYYNLRTAIIFETYRRDQGIISLKNMFRPVGKN